MTSVILFDIDRTLFDTDKFSQSYREKFIHYLQITSEKLEKIRTKYYSRLSKHTDYVPEEFIKHLINTLHRDKQPEIFEKLHNLFYERENFSRSLFPETVFTLTELKKHHRLGIFSEGHLSFQKTKIVKSAIYDFLDPKLIFISRRKTSPEFLSSLPENCTVVDDDPEVIESLVNQKTFPLNPIWLNRKNKEKLPHGKTIHSLVELT